MRFLPLFVDLSAGAVVLVGSGGAALAKLRLLRAAGAHVRWYSRNARHRRGGSDLARSRPDRDQHRRSARGGLARRDRRGLGGWRRARCQDCGARATRTHSDQRGRPAGSVDLHLSGHCRSRRGGGGDRHRRQRAGPGAAPARADRSLAACAHRRACRIDRPPSQSLRRRAARAVTASLLAQHGHRADRRCSPGRSRGGGGDAAARSDRRDRRWQSCGRDAKPCSWSAPAPAIPTC